MGLCFFINGLGNNTVIPIAHKIAVVYNLPSTYLNAPITASFLVYSMSNFPANFIIDTKGLRFSFLIGSGLYTLGIFSATLINHGYIVEKNCAAVIIDRPIINIDDPYDLELARFAYDKERNDYL